MLEDMQLRNFSAGTQRSHIHYVAEFCKVLFPPIRSVSTASATTSFTWWSNGGFRHGV